MKYCKTFFIPKLNLTWSLMKIKYVQHVYLIKRRNINWDEREKQFLKVVEDIKKQSKSNYHCVIPVSGGKDSTWQVLKILEYGLNPLCVNSRTCDFSELGKENLENIKNLV